jgi:hypothetical protein
MTTNKPVVKLTLDELYEAANEFCDPQLVIALQKTLNNLNDMTLNERNILVSLFKVASSRSKPNWR